MGKPEIIGYQNDPDNWDTPELPEMTFDSDGVSIPWWEIDSRTGMPFKTARRIEPDAMDSFMRYHGYKRVYKPREFRADPLGDGSYGVYCSTCVCYFQTELLPHDAAKLHAEVNHHRPADWPLAW
jgi:hypothetical protein